MAAITPAEPQNNPGRTHCDCPANTAKDEEEFVVVNRWSFPMEPHESFVPTIFGCSASVLMVSESRSIPAQTVGKL